MPISLVPFSNFVKTYLNIQSSLHRFLWDCTRIHKQSKPFDIIGPYPIEALSSSLSEPTTLGFGSNKFTGFVPSLVSPLKLNVLELDGDKFEKGLYVCDMNINDSYLCSIEQ